MMDNSFRTSHVRCEMQLRRSEEQIILLKKELFAVQEELSLYKGIKNLVNDFLPVSHKVRELCASLKLNGQHKCCKESDNVGCGEASVHLNHGNFKKIDEDKTKVPLFASPVEYDSCSSWEIDIKEEQPDNLEDSYNDSASVPQTTAPVSSESDCDVIWFGSRHVLKSRVRGARHAKATILAGELTSLVFSPEEMALCTVKGKKSNVHKNAPQKGVLDKECLRDIVAYVARHFGVTPTEVRRPILKAITYKLSNFSKSEKGRNIITRHCAREIAKLM